MTALPSQDWTPSAKLSGGLSAVLMVAAELVAAAGSLFGSVFVILALRDWVDRIGGDNAVSDDLFMCGVLCVLFLFGFAPLWALLAVPAHVVGLVAGWATAIAGAGAPGRGLCALHTLALFAWGVALVLWVGMFAVTVFA